MQVCHAILGKIYRAKIRYGIMKSQEKKKEKNTNMIGSPAFRIKESAFRADDLLNFSGRHRISLWHI